MIRIVLLAGLLSGCALPVDIRLSKRCDADQVIGYVGQRYTAELGGVVQKKAGARSVRVIGPDMMVTQDFRADRLNIVVDDTNAVTRLYCG